MTVRLSLVVSLLIGCSGKGDLPSAVSAGSTASAVAGASGGAGMTTNTLAGTGAGGASVAGTGAGGASVAGSGAGGTAAGTSAGAAGSDSAIPATFETVKLVFGGGGGVMPCSAAPCHGVNGVAPPDRPLELPPMNDQQLYTNLTSYVSRACNNTKLVTPGNPAQSALLTILKGPCGMTPRMPYGCSADAGDCIPDEYIAAVSQWIANGAPRP